MCLWLRLLFVRRLLNSLIFGSKLSFSHIYIENILDRERSDRNEPCSFLSDILVINLFPFLYHFYLLKELKVKQKKSVKVDKPFFCYWLTISPQEYESLAFSRK